MDNPTKSGRNALDAVIPMICIVALLAGLHVWDSRRFGPPSPPALTANLQR
jgi:hypothetical protein